MALVSEAGWNASKALKAITSSLGGSAVAAGASVTATVSIPGASSLCQYNSDYQNPAWASIDATPTNQGGPGAGFVWQAYLDPDTTDQIVVRLTNVTSGSLTPTAAQYLVCVRP